MCKIPVYEHWWWTDHDRLIAVYFSYKVFFLSQIRKKHVQSFESSAASGNELPYSGVADGRCNQ